MKDHLLKSLKKIFLVLLIVMFFSTNCAQSVSFAQMPTLMPQAGTMIGLTAPYVPPQLVGVEFDEVNPFHMSFLVNRGDKKLSLDRSNEEYMRFVKYFLSALTIPDENQWVNLSPYEGHRIVEESFGKTAMGKDLLAQDYILKQLASSLVYPEGDIGNKFWSKVRAGIRAKYGEDVDIPLDMFNRVWIVPSSADMYEDNGRVWIVDSHLKVMLEKDYVASGKFQDMIGGKVDQVQEMSPLVSDVMREVVIPALEKEVNEGSHFSALRQIYSAMILATWYKQNIKESILGNVYANQGKIGGIGLKNSEEEVKRIYDQYVESFRLGAFNYIKEEYDFVKQEIIPRKYFSGGFSRSTSSDRAGLSFRDLGEEMKNPNKSKGILNVLGEFFAEQEDFAMMSVVLKESNKNVDDDNRDNGSLQEKGEDLSKQIEENSRNLKKQVDPENEESNENVADYRDNGILEKDSSQVKDSLWFSSIMKLSKLLEKWESIQHEIKEYNELISLLEKWESVEGVLKILQEKFKSQSFDSMEDVIRYIKGQISYSRTLENMINDIKNSISGKYPVKMDSTLEGKIYKIMEKFKKIDFTSQVKDSLWFSSIMKLLESLEKRESIQHKIKEYNELISFLKEGISTELESAKRRILEERIVEGRMVEGKSIGERIAEWKGAEGVLDILQKRFESQSFDSIGDVIWYLKGQNFYSRTLENKINYIKNSISGKDPVKMDSILKKDIDAIMEKFKKIDFTPRVKDDFLVEEKKQHLILQEIEIKEYKRFLEILRESIKDGKYQDVQGLLIPWVAKYKKILNETLSHEHNQIKSSKDVSKVLGKIRAVSRAISFMEYLINNKNINVDEKKLLTQVESALKSESNYEKYAKRLGGSDSITLEEEHKIFEEIRAAVSEHLKKHPDITNKELRRSLNIFYDQIDSEKKVASDLSKTWDGKDSPEKVLKSWIEDIKSNILLNNKKINESNDSMISHQILEMRINSIKKLLKTIGSLGNNYSRSDLKKHISLLNEKSKEIKAFRSTVPSIRDRFYEKQVNEDVLAPLDIKIKELSEIIPLNVENQRRFDDVNKYVNAFNLAGVEIDLKKKATKYLYGKIYNLWTYFSEEWEPLELLERWEPKQYKIDRYNELIRLLEKGESIEDVLKTLQKIIENFKKEKEKKIDGNDSIDNPRTIKRGNEKDGIGDFRVIKIGNGNDSTDNSRIRKFEKWIEILEEIKVSFESQSFGSREDAINYLKGQKLYSKILKKTINDIKDSISGKDYIEMTSILENEIKKIRKEVVRVVRNDFKSKVNYSLGYNILNGMSFDSYGPTGQTKQPDKDNVVFKDKKEGSLNSSEDKRNLIKYKINNIMKRLERIDFTFQVNNSLWFPSIMKLSELLEKGESIQHEIKEYDELISLLKKGESVKGVLEILQKKFKSQSFDSMEDVIRYIRYIKRQTFRSRILRNMINDIKNSISGKDPVKMDRTLKDKIDKIMEKLKEIDFTSQVEDSLRDVLAEIRLHLDRHLNKTNLEGKDNAVLKEENVGGIDFDSSMLNMRIRRGVGNKPLDWNLQDHTMFDFSGLTPVIIEVVLVDDDIFPDIDALREKFINQEEEVTTST